MFVCVCVSVNVYTIHIFKGKRVVSKRHHDLRMFLDSSNRRSWRTRDVFLECVTNAHMLTHQFSIQKGFLYAVRCVILEGSRCFPFNALTNNKYSSGCFLYESDEEKEEINIHALQGGKCIENSFYFSSLYCFDIDIACNARCFSNIHSLS